MPLGNQSKRRKTSRSSFKRSKGSKGFKRYGDHQKKGALQRYLKAPGVIRSSSKWGYCPTGIEVTLSYASTVSITTTAGVNDAYVFSGNSLFDPNVTGTGSQPLGFDQWTAIYNRYIVYGSQATLEVLSTDTSTIQKQNFKVVLVPFSLTTGLASLGLDVCSELPRAKTKTCSVYAEGSNNTISSYASTASVYGVSNAYVDMDDSYTALFNASPTRQWAWWIKVNSLSDDQSTSYNVRMRIKYYAKMYQPVVDTGS